MAGKDEFFNRAYGTVYESANNTLTFAEIQSGFGLLEKRAWIIHRIEYYLLPATIAYLADTPDMIRFGLSVSNAITNVGIDRAEVIDVKHVYMTYLTGVGYRIDVMPIISDFNALPGGGMIMIPKPMFIFVQGDSLAAQAAVEARIYFTIKELKDADFLQLLETFRMIS